MVEQDSQLEVLERVPDVMETDVLTVQPWQDADEPLEVLSLQVVVEVVHDLQEVVSLQLADEIPRVLSVVQVVEIVSVDDSGKGVQVVVEVEDGHGQ